ncbi:hypothetical protein LEP1GSC112_0985 [Leptospira interrogans serovar Pomona str. UT364]|nr:hypothetical protein LEP1GSC112_0985 [Leptospira interrogans serovar Pomona str. UT364]
MSNPDIILTDDVEIHFLELCKFVKRDVRELRNLAVCVKAYV